MQPPSTALLRTEPKSPMRWQDFGVAVGLAAGGSGTPGPSITWGRPRL